MAEANSINATTAGIVGNTGTAFTGTPMTQYNVVVGGATSSTLSNVAPSATSGVPLISQGAASNPAFGTAVVAGGGTGATSFTAYAPICGGTTTTNPAQSASTGLGTAGFVLTSNGSSALPSFQSASASGAITTITGNSGGAESPSSGNFNIVGTGSITVAGSANTETVQLTGLTNHALQVGAGTATLTQLGAGTTGQVLQTNTSADPTWSTATYPSTTTSQQILYSTATNVVGQLTTANSKFPATNSSGTLAMRALSVVSQIFTSSGTYTPTSGMLYCIIECVGGGGGGGGCGSANATYYMSAGGGGGGGYARKTASAATIGASQTVTIGSAGSAGSAGNNAGGNGGDTSVGAICIGKGGTGGSGNPGTTIAAGGAGGVAGTGDFTVPGQAGGAGAFILSSSCGQVAAGGNAALGFGAGGALTTVSAANSTGPAGSLYGGGGAAGLSYNSGGNVAGAAGAAGIVVITEYVIA